MGKFLIILMLIGSLLCFNFYVGGFCIEYSVEYWGSLVKDEVVDIPKVPCRVAGLFFAQPAMAIAIVTWVVSFAIDFPHHKLEQLKST